MSAVSTRRRARTMSAVSTPSPRSDDVRDIDPVLQPDDAAVSTRRRARPMSAVSTRRRAQPMSAVSTRRRARPMSAVSTRRCSRTMSAISTRRCAPDDVRRTTVPVLQSDDVRRIDPSPRSADVRRIDRMRCRRRARAIKDVGRSNTDVGWSAIICSPDDRVAARLRDRLEWADIPRPGFEEHLTLCSASPRRAALCRSNVYRSAASILPERTASERPAVHAGGPSACLVRMRRRTLRPLRRRLECCEPGRLAPRVRPPSSAAESAAPSNAQAGASRSPLCDGHAWPAARPDAPRTGLVEASPQRRDRVPDRGRAALTASGGGRSLMSIGPPARSQPTDSSQVRGGTTGTTGGPQP
jgi:hypothetical protein